MVKKIYLEEDDGCDGYYQIVAVPNGVTFDFHAIVGTEAEIEKFKSMKGAMILPNLSYHRCDYEMEEDAKWEIRDRGLKDCRSRADLEVKGFLCLAGLEIDTECRG
jgi:hypothetical protein